MQKKKNLNIGGYSGWNNDGDNRRSRDASYDADHNYRGDDWTRNVSFKPGSSSRICKQKHSQQIDFDPARLAHTREGNIDMSSTIFRPPNLRGARNNPNGVRGRGRGGLQGRQVRWVSHHSNTLERGPTNWYKITIPHSAKLGRELVLLKLQEFIAPATMVPYVFKTSGDDATFFVDNFETASSLLAADGRVYAPDGRKLHVRAGFNFPPCRLNQPLMETLKHVMARRYNEASNALDLARLHADPGLAGHADSAVVLARRDVAAAVFEMVAANAPALAALNICGNDIAQVRCLALLAAQLPALVVLHLADNKIRDVCQLNCLKPLRLVDLVLAGNPMVERFADRGSYVREMQARFPKLIKLDGTAIPPLVTFEDEEPSAPPPVAGWLADPTGADFVRLFVEQYFHIYDAVDRSPLVEAYHDAAVFSLACANVAGGKAACRSLAAYFPLSRNLLKTGNAAQRDKQLMRGPVDIVSFLRLLPQTLHYARSFAVDMPIYTPGLIQVNVSGTMREVGTSQQYLRSFGRVFIIVPVAAGFCIVNETLFITNVTDELEKTAFKAPPPSLAPSSTIPTDDPDVKQRMVEIVHQQSGMNIVWATKCLEETQWNLDLAMSTFTQLSKMNKIPGEAFV